MNVAVLVVVVMLLAIRAPAALSFAPRRPAWLATLFASIGLLTLGLLWPAKAVDSFLGSTEILDLVQVLAATSGFWFLRNAMIIHENEVRTSRLSVPPGTLLFLILTAETVTFLLVPHRHGPPLTYIHERLGSDLVWTHILIYLVAIGWLSSDSAILLRDDPRPSSRLFATGNLLIVVAIALEIADVTLDHVAGHPTTTSTAFLAAFNALFYPGMLTITAGYALIVVPRLRRDIPWRLRGLALSRILWRTRRFATRLTPTGWHALTRDPFESATESFIEIHNRLNAGAGHALSQHDHLTLTHVGRHINERTHALSDFPF